MTRISTRLARTSPFGGVALHPAAGRVGPRVGQVVHRGDAATVGRAGRVWAAVRAELRESTHGAGSFVQLVPVLAEVPGELPGELPGGLPGDLSGDLPGDLSGDLPGGLPGLAACAGAVALRSMLAPGCAEPVASDLDDDDEEDFTFDTDDDDEDDDFDEFDDDFGEEAEDDDDLEDDDDDDDL